MNDDSGLDTLRRALRRLPAPEPSHGLLQRILTSRAAAVRVALPEVNERSGPTRQVWWIAVAAGLAVAIGLFMWSGKRDARQGAPRRDTFTALLRGTLVWPAPGAAQESGAAPQAPRYALIAASGLDTSRVLGGTWTYESRTTTDEVLTATTGRIRITLAPATYQGRRVWMTNSVREGPQRWGGFSDTAYLDPRTLRPLQHTLYGYKGRTRVFQRFSSDSGWESINITGPRPRSSHREVALPFPGDVAFVTNWYLYDLRIVAQAFRLARGWRGSLYQVWWFSLPQRDAFVPVDLHVVGRERVRVPAGTFDCWRLEVETRFGEYERFRMWVTEAQGWVVKTQHRGSDYVVEELLASVTPSAP